MRKFQPIINAFWDSVLIIVVFASLYLFFEIVDRLTKKENGMPKFRKKVKIVEATRWFPEKQVEGVIQVTGEKFGHCVTIQQVLTKVCPGDWVITESDGQHHYPCDDKEFRASYDPVDDDAVKALNEEQN